MPVKLIADSGSTKCAWVLLSDKKIKKFSTAGLNPYFLDKSAIGNIITGELIGQLKSMPDEIYFYGTAMGLAENKHLIKSVLRENFSYSKIDVQTDILAAARAVCGNSKGLAAILGTGSSVCFYDGKKISKSRPGLGFILGDEGSGAYVGKKVIQHFLYETFDDELMRRFTEQFNINKESILSHVYSMPLPNKYLATFALFLAANRGHFMVENILEDSFREFFSLHIEAFKETKKYPVGFVGSIAFGFKDVLENLCEEFGFAVGKIIQSPLDGLLVYHNEK